MDITYYILTILAVLIVLTVHEFSHGYCAYKLGDPTAKAFGRLSLNPIRHLDPIGTLCMIFFRFGWAKPVPINPRNLKNPKRDFALVALAGPLSNLLLAFFSAFLYLLLYKFITMSEIKSELLNSIVYNTLKFVLIFHSLNIGLGIFNLIPVPPLDGSRILNVILPSRAYFSIMRYERIIYWVLIGWLFAGDYVKNAFLSFSFISNNPILSGIAGIFSLSDMLSSLMLIVSDLMISFWQLIPFLA